MKCKKLVPFVIASIVLVAVLNVKISVERHNASFSLALANVEALAIGEDVRGMVECNGSGQLYCYLTNKCEYNEILIYQ